MSNISVGAKGATTGRQDQTIPGKGDINSKREAEAALTFLPEGSTNTVKGETREYSRDDRIAIRDNASTPVEDPDAATPPAPGGSATGNSAAMAKDPSNGFFLKGYYAGGLDKTTGHSGGGLQLG